MKCYANTIFFYQEIKDPKYSTYTKIKATIHVMIIFCLARDYDLGLVTIT